LRNVGYEIPSASPRHAAALAVLEDARDVGALHGLEGRRSVAVAGGESEEGALGGDGRRRPAGLRQDDVPLVHERSARQDDGPFDDVAKLAHVSRIVVRRQRQNRLRGETGEVLLDAAREKACEGEREIGNVLAPRGERRDDEPEDRQAMVQVLRKREAATALVHVLVGGGDDA